MALPVGFFYLGKGDVLPATATFGACVAGGWLFFGSVVAERRWHAAAILEAAEHDTDWRAALSEVDPQAPFGALERLASSGGDLVAQAADLDNRQLERLRREATYHFKRYRGREGLREFLIRAAERDNAQRAAEARGSAILAARSAIEARGWMADYARLLLAAQQAANNALTKLPNAHASDVDAVLATIESAVLARVAEPSLRSDQFAALYGPWWRAVVGEREPMWAGPWSNVSLAGFWLTVCGIPLSATLNHGDAGYVSVIVVGVALLAVGALHGAMHSVPEPAPRSRSLGLV